MVVFKYYQSKLNPHPPRLHTCTCRNIYLKFNARYLFIIHLFLCFIGQEVAGKLSLKHIYEIAKIKETSDNRFRGMSLECICKSLIGQCHNIGIEVVRDLKPEDYGKFLKEREEIVKEQEAALEAKRQAKLLRQ